ncbi:MAG: GatB/YqeY domain-containing protein [Clostridia bacterium]|nr:GatB/YqeY domain-containing protein [Clostridia bacterium]
MLKEKLMDDLKLAMREKNEIRKNTVQMVRAAILQIEKDKGIVVEDDKIIEIIAKEVKSKKDALVDFEKGGREDLISQTNEEIAILQEYLPKQLTREEIKVELEKVISDLGATSMKDMGPVMKEAKARIGAAADGRTINDVVKELLG